jgi:putative endonuclease
MSYYVYILTNCRYGVLYVGVTNNLLRRISEHRLRLVPGFTKEYGVIRLVYFEEFGSITQARARERSLKRWTAHGSSRLSTSSIPNGATSRTTSFPTA